MTCPHFKAFLGAQVLHEHLGRLNEPSVAAASMRAVPPALPAELDPVEAKPDPVARKRDAAEQVAAFRWRPAPPKVRSLKVDGLPDGHHAGYDLRIQIYIYT